MEVVMVLAVIVILEDESYVADGIVQCEDDLQ
jgi:hypothetical protein